MYLEGSLGMTVQHQEKFGSNFDVFRGENEASALKSIIYWSSPNLGATNSSGFTALPGGGCSYVGEYINPGETGVWWTSSQVSENSAWFRRIYYSSERIERNQSISKRSGVSVRCVRD
jgi:uncharacterized protein (TIGR02145 family)